MDHAAKVTFAIIAWVVIGGFDAGMFNGFLRHDFADLDRDAYHARQDCGVSIVIAGMTGPFGIPAVAMWTGGYASSWTLSCSPLAANQ